MPHRRRIEHPGHARFLTFSCYQRLALFGNDAIKDAFVETIESARNRYEFKLTAYVVMPEHVHLLIFPDQAVGDVTAILKTLKTGFAKRASVAGSHWTRQLRSWSGSITAEESDSGSEGAGTIGTSILVMN